MSAVRTLPRAATALNSSTTVFLALPSAFDTPETFLRRRFERCFADPEDPTRMVPRALATLRTFGGLKMPYLAAALVKTWAHGRASPKRCFRASLVVAVATRTIWRTT